MIKKWILVGGAVSIVVSILAVLHLYEPPRHTILRIHTESEPKTLDPAQATGAREFQILQAILEGLTRYHPQTLVPLPGAAQSWEISPEGLRYLFHLRKDAKWSDGKPVTAQDFWDGWERLLSPETQSPYAFQLFYLKGGEAYAKGELKDPQQIGMRVADPNTFEVTLERPVPYFLLLTCFSALAPLRKDAPEPYLIGNGAFVFQSKTPHEGIRLRRNEYYWGRKEVKLAGVQIRPFSDFATALKFYDATGIDILADLPPTQVSLLKFRADYRSAPILRAEYFTINCKNPPFDKVEVRQALSFATEREFITDQALKRGDLPYGFLVPPGIPGYQNPPKGQEFNLEAAKGLLQKAGFGPNKPFPVLQIHYNNATDRQLVAEAAQTMWGKNLGVESQLVMEEWEPYLKNRQKKNFQISWGGWGGDYMDPQTFLELFTSDNRQNHAGWSNEAYDALIKKAQETIDPNQRAQLLKEAEAILLQEVPIIAVLTKTKNYLIQPYIKGYYPNLMDRHPLQDVYSLRP